ncbi:MAG TPA: hypothetical protein VFB34_10115 [Chloroflexota bacterium]|nr:hypothetical protein [Chloroflexota bacterium]
MAVVLTALVLPTVVAGCSGSRTSEHGGPYWQYAGLTGKLIHSVAFSSTGRVGFAGTEAGIYREIGHGPWRKVLPHGEFWSVDASPNGRFVVAGDNAGSVASSTDGGNHWRSRLVDPSGIFAVTISPGESHRLLAGGAGGIFSSDHPTSTWRRRAVVLGGAADGFGWLPGSGRVVFAAALPGGFRRVPAILKSVDGGLSWKSFSRHMTPAGAMSILAPSPRRVLAGTMGLGVWSSRSTASFWYRFGQGMPRYDDHVAGLVLTGERSRPLWLGTQGFGAFYSRDGGRRWTADSGGLPLTAGRHLILGLAYRPDDRCLYAATDQGIYRLPLSDK